MRSSRITKLICAVNPNAIVRFEGTSFLVILSQSASVEERERIDRVVQTLSTTDEFISGSGWWEGAKIPGQKGEFRCARFALPRSRLIMRLAGFGLFLWFLVWLGGCDELLNSKRESWWVEIILFHIVIVAVAIWLFMLATEGENTLHEIPKKWRSFLKKRRRFSQAEMAAYRELLRKAANNPGDPEAQFQLAMHYLHGTAPERKSQDIATAWLEEAARRGHIEAFHTLYRGYRNRNSPESRQKALMYLRQAAEAGDANSQNDLALELLLSGHRDHSEIAGWLLKAAKQGHREAAWSVAQHYEEGDGVPLDLEKALEWYQTAALRGHELAEQKVKRLSFRPERN